VSIAALARASAAGASGDSSAAQYLAGAKRAYAHLKENPTRYQDDGKENIIDDYCGLLAAAELYSATNDNEYLADAHARAASLLSRQSAEGWFYSGKDAAGGNIRPFYHAADEGLPVVALSRYYEAVGAQNKAAVRDAIGKNLRFYHKITYKEGNNPFEYAKMYRAAGGGGAVAGVDLARNKAATASRVEASYTADKAFNGNTADRWSSYENGAENDSQWISVDLGEIYKVNRVVLNWEAAYGKDYRIEVSANGASWAAAAEITNNGSAGRKEHAFAPVDAKFVRMFGITRGNPNGGFSLYQFEVYGEQSDAQPPSDNAARFFVPHENETGYWWQGENARLASLSAAFTMGAPIADRGGALWNDTIYAMATAQLDWILGRNPFELCMMSGYGVKNYPVYPAGRNKNEKGGICNGITSARSNENDIEWAPYPAYPADEWWGNWRWIEQWIPHNAWYLTAISSLSHMIEHGIAQEPPDGTDGAMRSAAKTPPRLKISAARGKGVRVELPFGADERTNIAIYDMRGKKVHAQNVQLGARSVSMNVPAKTAAGTYILAVKDVSGKNRASGRILLR
jgi:hypothetical protein